ncbi:MAG: tetratricopeptide repeat protein [Deltaproteobacteria bacterium]|nr:tetratricopeptide repeat protein [Deltaproteobacteria bacterium]
MTAGRCVVAVSGALLRDAEVMLAIAERPGLSALALSGPAQAPVLAVGESSLAAALGRDGVLLLLEPEAADGLGVEAIVKHLERAKAKPTVVVVARSWNPFQFPKLGAYKVVHEKGRGKPVLQALPKAAAPAPASLPEGETAEAPVRPPRATAPGEPAAPRFAFVGREEEQATLVGLLGEGGPLVVSGPPGIGRNWLVEHAVAASGLARLPDLALGWGSGFDALIARLAEICRLAGSTRLAEVLQSGAMPSEKVDAALEALGTADLSGKVMVVRHLEFGLGREPDFFRRSRLELLLEALLCGTFSLRLVFVSTRQPHFHREGAATGLRRLEVGGIKGRFYSEIFTAYKAPEFPRDRFGPLHEKLHGHPIAIRVYAIAVRDRPDGLALTEDNRFLKLESAADLEPVGKQIHKKLERLSDENRKLLSRLAHCRHPVPGALLSDLGVSRKARLELLADGLLDMIGTESDKKYRVHEMVREHLTWREITDFDVFAGLAEIYGKMARESSDPVEKITLQQETNRCAFGARNKGLALRPEFPDHDPLLEAAIGMIRSEKPRFDIAGERIAEVLDRDPTNSDAWLLELERLDRMDSKPEEVVAVLEQALEKAPVPELFQWGAGFWLGRKARPKAISMLEQGIPLLPKESRLRTRLAALLLRQGRRPEGIAQLEEAMRLDPMLPDSYGLLGQARRDEGAIETAEALLREAVRLAPDDPTQVGRLADLLIARARASQPEVASAVRAEAKAMLDPLIKGDRKAAEAHLLLARLVREDGGDLERASWLLKKARKLSERHSERHYRIALEEILIDAITGKLDPAEAAAREVTARDPAGHRGFSVLGQVLAMREMYVAAHAEFLRAKERVAKDSLEGKEYDDALSKMQAMIELQATRLYAGDDVEAMPSGPSAASFSRVIRRRKEEPAVTADADAETERMAMPTPEDEPENLATPPAEPAPGEPAVEQESPVVEQGSAPEEAPPPEEPPA